MSRSNDIANITSSVLDGVTKAEVGLGNVDNTADSAKPVSTAQQSAIDLKANIASPTFTGDLTTPNITLTNGGNITMNGSLSSGTIGSSVSLPTKVTDRTAWYKMFGNSGGTLDTSGNWVVTPNLDEGQGRIVGCAPDGFTSVVAMEAWWFSTNSNPGAASFTMEWSIAANNEGQQNHQKDVTGISISSNFGTYVVRKTDIFNAANDGADLEDVIQANDVFGIRFHMSNTSAYVGGIGVKITWRF